MKNIALLKKLSVIGLIAVIADFHGATLIYKGSDNEKKVISEVELLSIDKNIITFEVGKSYQTIPLSKLLKYYDTDINLNLVFDDNSADYTIFIRDLKFPANKRGYTLHHEGKGKRKRENTISFEYSITPKAAKGQTRMVREPYFYLSLLTVGKSSDDKKVYSFFAPDEAKIKNTRLYNEALMLEKALSGERKVIDPFAHTSSVTSKHPNITIPIGDIKDRKIIAYRLIVWGKEEIIHIKSEIFDHQYSPGKNWHLLHHGRK